MYADNSHLLSYPAPGTVVSIPLLLWFRHRGVVTDRWHNGKPTVISGSARVGNVAEESWDSFAGGRPVKADGYPSRLPAHEVVRRSRELIGARYHLLNFNCDHVAAAAHGRELASRQLVATVAIAALAAALWAAS